jgi:hypothetical protein
MVPLGWPRLQTFIEDCEVIDIWRFDLLVNMR